jgi:transposase
MSSRRQTAQLPPPEAFQSRSIAQSASQQLESHAVGALPILNHLLERIQFLQILESMLPREDRRVRVPAATGLVMLLKNYLLAREPLYGVSEWSLRQAPDLLGLSPGQLQAFNDDRIGRCLDRLFAADCGAVALRVATQAVREFQVSLDELHNDSTTITFHGAYAEAQTAESRPQGRVPAITWGHNKDHRPDLKQVLYLLTVTGDGAVPVQFRVESGNTTDDQTHQATWDVLCTLSGRRDFLYVADSKLATRENMAYIHQRNGRFVSVLPRTRQEDRTFREVLQRGEVQWSPLWARKDEAGEIEDQFAFATPVSTTSDGYRLVWYHSTRKADIDALTRTISLERAVQKLHTLKLSLPSPRARRRTETQVQEAVDKILADYEVGHLMDVRITAREKESFRQARRGRPNHKTRYVRDVAVRFDLEFEASLERIAQDRISDGVFPLVSNDLKLSEKELLCAYKNQPQIEKRFSQLKTDFAVAPVHLHSPTRIVAFLCVYFFALLLEALLERELRRQMVKAKITSLPLYPEGRPCRRPTARRVLDLFDNVQRHTLRIAEQPPVELLTEFSPLQRQLLKLLRLRPEDYGRRGPAGPSVA